MTDTADKLAPFAAMLDSLDDDALAAAAGVTIEEAAAFRAAGAKPAPETVDKKPKKGSKAKPAPDAATEPHEAPVVEDAPAVVRVTLKGRATIAGANGNPLRVSYRDVYSGEQAAYLWEHNREIVEAFPTKG